jgi:hypothetical protein
MNFETNHREPAQKEYHTGPRAAGRESAARQCVVKDKDARKKKGVTQRDSKGKERAAARLCERPKVRRGFWATFDFLWLGRLKTR